MTGRFTSADTHWNPDNMIYGDSPRKINERETSSGQKTFTLIPDMDAIRQSSNLYTYGLHNPTMFQDMGGAFIITTLVICIIAGALIGGTVGGIAGNAIAKANGVAQEDRWKYIVGGILLGAAVGAAIGYLVAPAVVSATGVAGISVTSSGISTVAAGGSLAVPEYVNNAGSFIKWAEQAFEKTKEVLGLEQIKQLFGMAEQYGVKITADLEGHAGTAWTMAHIHLGNARIHIAVAKEVIEWIMKYLS